LPGPAGDLHEQEPPLRQALHILRKDLRRHWPTALVFGVLLAAFAVQQPRDWRGDTFHNRFFDRLVEFLPTLLVLAWAFFLVRLAHEEGFIGDRQFWITRPYEWYKLLAAKFLGAIFFIHLPLFVMQLVLLNVAHFPVASSIPGLLWIHFLFVLILDLPCLAVAAVTSGLGQASLVVVASLLFMGGVLAILNYITDFEFVMDQTGPVLAVLFLGTGLAAIFIQYIHRHSRLARFVVAGSFLLAAMLVFSAPSVDLASSTYPLPAPNRPSPAHFALDRTLAFQHESGQRTFSFDNQETIEIPVNISGLADQTVFQFQAVELSMALPKGEHWSSHWQHFSQSVAYGRTRSWVTVKLKRADFLRFANAPAHARIAMAFDVFKLGAGSRLQVNGPTLSLPGGARCLYRSSTNNLKCFSPLRTPSPLFLIADLPNSSCRISQEASQEPWAAAPAFDITLSTDQSPDPDLSPIQDRLVSLDRYTQFEDVNVAVPICRGTTLFVNQPQFLYSNRVEIDLGEIILDDYRPTYPRQIGPPPKHLVPDDPSNSLSLNFSRFSSSFPADGRRATSIRRPIASR
jgi:hypothetical protein